MCWSLSYCFSAPHPCVYAWPWAVELGLWQLQFSFASWIPVRDPWEDLEGDRKDEGQKRDMLLTVCYRFLLALSPEGILSQVRGFSQQSQKQSQSYLSEIPMPVGHHPLLRDWAPTSLCPSSEFLRTGTCRQHFLSGLSPSLSGLLLWASRFWTSKLLSFYSPDLHIICVLHPSVSFLHLQYFNLFNQFPVLNSLLKYLGCYLFSCLDSNQYKSLVEFSLSRMLNRG